MTTFTDGPATGKRLMLKRAPMFLRVVIDGKGEVDALDQLSDEARAGERVYCYVVEGTPSWCHIRASKGSGGFFTMATYRVYMPQPDEATLRDNRKWAEWATRTGTDRLTKL